MFLTSLSGLLNTQNGPGAILTLGQKLGLLPPMASVLVDSFKRAPSPTRVELSDDWFENIDTISHSLGCVLGGFFDELFLEMGPDEIKSLQADSLEHLLPPGMLRTIGKSSFEVCKAVYLEVGPLSDAISSGKVKPEGLITQVAVNPFMKRYRKDDDKPSARRIDVILGQSMRDSARRTSSTEEV
jgi:hypothetical protein